MPARVHWEMRKAYNRMLRHLSFLDFLRFLPVSGERFALCLQTLEYGISDRESLEVDNGEPRANGGSLSIAELAIGQRVAETPCD